MCFKIYADNLKSPEKSNKKTPHQVGIYNLGRKAERFGLFSLEKRLREHISLQICKMLLKI